MHAYVVRGVDRENERLPVVAYRLDYELLDLIFICPVPCGEDSPGFVKRYCCPSRELMQQIVEVLEGYCTVYGELRQAEPPLIILLLENPVRHAERLPRTRGPHKRYNRRELIASSQG